MYRREFVERCKQLFEWSTVDAEDIDDDKYQFAKKFSEVSASNNMGPAGSLTQSHTDDILPGQLPGS